MVIVYHSVFFSTWFRTPGGTLLWNLNAGVSVFFVTSGFLLYRPFAQGHRRAAEGTGGGTVAIRHYALRRVARIYPAYWVVLAFFYWVVPRIAFDNGTPWRHITLTFTYWHAKNPFLVGLPPAWSLVTEMTFYLFLPFFAFAIGACTRRWRPASAELAGCAVLVSCSVIAIVAIGLGADQPWLTVLPEHLAAFAGGMFLAVVVSYDWSETATAFREAAGRSAALWWALAAAVFVAIPVVLRIRPFASMSAWQSIGLDVAQQLFGFCIVVPAVLGPQRLGLIRRTLASRVLTWLGLISYGLYLWHWFILRIVQEDWFGWPLQKGNWVAVFLAAMPVIITAAAASWYIVERPIIKGVRVLSRPTPARARR